MEFTIGKDYLLAAIDKCQLATDDKHQTEAFTVMTVDATKKKTVRFAAVGQYCSVDTVTESETKSFGSFNVKPKHLRGIVSSMPPGRIQISLKGERVTIKSLVSSRKASFQNHTLDIFKVSDPGKDVAWVDVDAPELVRALAAVKAAASWTNRTDPDGCLLVPTERGLSLFGCNMYLLARVDTSLRMDGSPIIMPAAASAVLALMAADDASVRLFADDHRVYMENTDTLVSAPLFDYKFLPNYQMFWGMIEDKDNIAGPVLSLVSFVQGVKAVLACSGFASEKERETMHGTCLHVSFGNHAEVSLDLAEADAKDEFDVIRPGAEFRCYVDSALLLQLLGSFGSSAEVQILLAHHEPTTMLVVRTKGLTYGLMTREKK